MVEGKMDYDALTVDTNIFDENALNLEGGMLQQLYQFGQGSAQFIMSEIVHREVHRHLTDQAQKAIESLASAIKRTAQTSVFGAGAVKKLDAMHSAAVAPETAAQNRLVRFMANTGYEIIPA